MSSPLLSPTQQHAPLVKRIVEVVGTSWDLGLVMFGGPPVHFQIYHKRFVDGYKWIDEQTYQELFAVCQALPGPASTKFGYCITLIHAGFIPAFLAFLMFCLPGAVGMYALSLGVSGMSDTLPRPVYALLCGLNSATVGIIALAAVQLGQRAISDKLSRALVFFGATAGMLYNALWYFPMLMLLAGLVTVAWDLGWGLRFVHSMKRRVKNILRRQRRGNTNGAISEERPGGEIWATSVGSISEPSSAHRRIGAQLVNGAHRQSLDRQNGGLLENQQDEDAVNGRVLPESHKINVFSMPVAALIVVGFFVSFIAIMVTRALLESRPIGLSLFSNLYLAGTIIFGGGPVVIPLLRQYIVDEGWVSSRDFLLGLAVIQAFPGPNFNIAVYLGSLAAINSGSMPSIVGALMSFAAIFAPGMLLATGSLTFWSTLRSRRWVSSVLRGVNAAAVGLVYTAVYRLWEIGYVDENFSNGTSLGRDPWWVVITATSFVGTAWFGFPAPFAIVLGGVLGLLWFVVVNAGHGGLAASVLETPKFMVQHGGGVLTL